MPSSQQFLPRTFQVITGMRPGEVLGLRPGDVRNGLICVRRSLSARGEWTSGTTANASRDIPLTGYARDEIAHQTLLLRVDGMQNCPLLFPGENGKPAKQGTYGRHLAVYCEHNSITVVSPHELRHTFISMNQSTSIDVVKRIAGHSESMDTLGVYGHDVDGDAERTARMLDEVMRGIL